MVTAASYSYVCIHITVALIVRISHLLAVLDFLNSTGYSTTENYNSRRQ